MTGIRHFCSLFRRALGDGVRDRRALSDARSYISAGRSGRRKAMSGPLDNPVWHALTGPHAWFAFGRGAARHFPRDVAPFSAIAEPTASAYGDLAADLPPGLEARLFRPTKEATPPGWETISARPIDRVCRGRLGHGAVRHHLNRATR